jgi:hypothetical protein
VATDLAEIGFAEGMQRILDPGGGWPSTTRWRLSQAPIAADSANPQVGELYRGSEFSLGDLNECAGTGYAHQDLSTPTPVNGIITVTPAPAWTVPAGDSWSSQVWSLVATDADLLLLYAWSLVSSPLTAVASSGTSSLTVADASLFSAGATVRIGWGATFETATVLSVAGNVVTLTAPLAHTHGIGERATASVNLSSAGSFVTIGAGFHVFLQNVGGN